MALGTPKTVIAAMEGERVITHGRSGKKYTLYMTGLTKAIDKLNRLLEKYENRTLTGVSRAALMIRRRSLELTPMDTGNLRESCFVVWTGGVIGAGKSPNFVTGGERKATEKEVDVMYAQHNKQVDAFAGVYSVRKTPIAVIMYSAYYALLVHEQKRTYNHGQWQFLRTALTQSRDDVKNIIKATLKEGGE